jgi:CrcB protein
MARFSTTFLASGFQQAAAMAKRRGMNPPTQLIASLFVALGGGTGAVMRYQLGRGMTHWLGHHIVGAFPWPTLAANVIGSMAMGLLVGFLARHGHGGEHWRLLLGVGMLGGFTTFSSFSMEMMLLIERGQPSYALAYALVSVIAGLCALYLGLVVMRTVG